MTIKQLINSNSIVCFFDGACEPYNPGGNMGLGALIFIEGKEWFTYSNCVRAHPLNSNNVAEYGSLLIILNTLSIQELHEKVIHIYGDSMLVVNQMNGKWRIKNGFYVETALECKELFRRFKNTVIQWIPRELNELADNLSKELVENKKPA